MSSHFCCKFMGGCRRGILDIVIRFNTIGQQWYLYLVCEAFFWDLADFYDLYCFFGLWVSFVRLSLTHSFI
ncbi:hypothetical protein HanPI659440_Chr02g0037371 [Helianthus annuus]|nr:hypothetical protein HanPI659440_Chr02g0037371 [Helianthus annuus]